MFYPDFMQKYRPLYAPDAAGAGAGDGAAAAPAGGAADPAAALGSAAPGESPAAAAPALSEPAPGADVPAPEPTLLDGAPSSAEPAADAPPAADESPAPADEATKTEGEGEAPKPDAEAAKTDPDAKDATAEDQQTAPIVYDAFTLPEGVTFDNERLGKFTEVAGKAHIPQDVAQSLVSLHVEEMQRFSQEVSKATEQNQRDVWQKLNNTWKDDFRKDERLGGNRAETSLAMAKAVLEEYGGTPEQVRDLLAHTSVNGMGNYPGFIRLLVNIGEAMSVFEESEAPINPNAPKHGGKRSDRWYPSMGNGKA